MAEGMLESGANVNDAIQIVTDQKFNNAEWTGDDLICSCFVDCFISGRNFSVCWLWIILINCAESFRV